MAAVVLAAFVLAAVGNRPPTKVTLPPYAALT